MEPVSVVRPFDDVTGRIRSEFEAPTSVLVEGGNSSGHLIEKHGVGEVFE